MYSNIGINIGISIGISIGIGINIRININIDSYIRRNSNMSISSNTKSDVNASSSSSTTTTTTANNSIIIIIITINYNNNSSSPPPATWPPAPKQVQPSCPPARARNKNLALRNVLAPSRESLQQNRLDP
ncbi:hypothetical protein MBR_05094, partial [Metarhizium brunneum ARSEF 3297]